MKRIFGSLDQFLESGDVMGRKVANTRFLHALLASGAFDEYHFYLPGARECQAFRDQAQRLFPAQAGRMRALPRKNLPAGLAEHDYHVFHLSDCITCQPQLARLRNLHSPQIFPVTGVTHSLSYAHYGAAFMAHLWPGASPRDCIVCTSRSGRTVVERYVSGLRRGYGLSEETHPGPTLRRVPLAVDAQEIRPAADSERAGARGRLGLDSSRPVLLVFGRLSHYSKMDLLPLLRAMDRLGAQTEPPVLALAGWTEEGESYHEAVAGLAQSLGVEVRVFARPSETAKLDLYRAADIFLSIADNPQETFGITILEAMAAGLPVVASEYDGYRDLVRHGSTGLLVPTLSPDQTPETDALAPLLYDSDTHLLLAQQTAVDVPGLALAVNELLASPETRASMGRAGRIRVEERYCWERVIKDYLSLWEELWTLPAQHGKEPHVQTPLHQISHPMEVGYGQTFGHYSSDNFSPGLLLRQSPLGERVYQGKALPVIYPGIADRVDPGSLKKLLFAARKPAAMGELAARLEAMAPNAQGAGAAARRETVQFLLAWALKHDYLEQVS